MFTDSSGITDDILIILSSSVASTDTPGNEYSDRIRLRQASNSMKIY